VADAPTPQIFCIVTTDPDRVAPGGGAPVFVANDVDEQARIAMWMSRTTDAIVHDLHNGVFVLTVNLPGSGGGG
jgi:hypothetical protein